MNGASAWIKYLAKLWPALAAAIAQAGIAVAPGSDAGTSVTGSEWVEIGLAAAAALGVYVLRNGPKPGAAAAPGATPDGAGTTGPAPSS